MRLSSEEIEQLYREEIERIERHREMRKRAKARRLAKKALLGEQEHIVYRTCHLPTNHFYIGYHNTHAQRLDYLGSGTALLQFIREHEVKDFTRETLAQFQCETKARAVEAALIRRHARDPLCLNMRRTDIIKIAKERKLSALSLTLDA